VGWWGLSQLDAHKISVKNEHHDTFLFIGFLHYHATMDQAKEVVQSVADAVTGAASSATNTVVEGQNLVLDEVTGEKVSKSERTTVDTVSRTIDTENIYSKTAPEEARYRCSQSGQSCCCTTCIDQKENCRRG
jgi:hypothetical protein